MTTVRFLLVALAFSLLDDCHAFLPIQRNSMYINTSRISSTELHDIHRPVDGVSRRVILGGSVATFAGWFPSKKADAAFFQSNESSQTNGTTMTAQGPKNKRLGGLANKIRKVGTILDELQRDLMQERWDLVEAYPAQLRSYVPVFTAYTDSAFPTDAPTDKGLRVALRYEVGRFFASLERFKQACSRKSVDEAYIAYSDMSLHFDRYMRVGGLYSYYDDSISNEPYFKGISDDALVYANPIVDPPQVRDLVVIIKGPDKGRTGIIIGIYPDGSNRCAVKLDRYKGMREIRLLPYNWVAKRVGEQDPDDVFLIPRKNS